MGKKADKNIYLKRGSIIHCCEQFRYCRVILNSDLKGDNYGRVGSNGFCVWNGRSGCTSASRKTYKDFKRKRDSRRQLQGRVNHCLETLSDCGVIQNSELKKSIYERNKSRRIFFNWV